MKRAILYLVLGLIATSVSRAQSGDSLKKAEQLLASFTSPAPDKLKVEKLQPALPDTATVVGTWKGVSIHGDSKISVTMVFDENGVVTNTASNGASGRGTWTLDGQKIEVTWSTGFTVRWQIDGKEITGKGTSSKGVPWSLAFTKE